MTEIELISTASRLAEVADLISREPRVGVDLESNGFFRYPERVCLVQLAAAGTAYIIDPLAIDDLQPLGRLLSEPSVEKVFHAADYDLRSLDRDWGFRVNNLFDTGIAAAFVGSAHLGLQAVLQEHLRVDLAKSRELQRSDWTIRPLGSEALHYAANDVLYLSRVREALAARLKKLSRVEWANEEFSRMEKVRFTPRDSELAFLAIKGSGGLDGKGLAVLRSLAQFREREARRLDRPFFKVIRDSELVLLASDTEAKLSAVKGLGRFGRPPASLDLRAAIDEGLEAQPVTRPKRTRNDDLLTPAERDKAKTRLGVLKAWRARLGRELGLDVGLLWPAVSLERLSRQPDSLETELVSPEVRGWQKREFSAGLEAVLAGMQPVAQG